MRKVRNREKHDTKRGAAIFFAVLRITAALMCGFLLYTFVFTMCLNQINHGNVIGSIFCIGVILLVILYPKIRQRKPLRITAKIIAAAQIAFALYCGVISALISSEIISGAPQAEAVAAAAGGTPQTVIVLGCKTINDEPSVMLAMRLDKAIEYLNTHQYAVCVVSGGMGSDEAAPEAVTMRKYLLRNGIADGRIYVEPDSANTAENIRNSAAIIEAESLPADVVVVSECYHIFRGVRQARLAGLHAAGICPSSDPVIITLPSYWLREIFAVTRDLLFG